MLLSFEKTYKLLDKYKISHEKSYIVTNPEMAVKISNKIGYPVVFKIDSPNIIHKTDAGGVITNIKDSKDANNSYHKIVENVSTHNPEAIINGIIVQKQIHGRELLIGMKRDNQFGPVIVFGIGGIFVELFKDVSRRIAPITKEDAKEMLEEIKGKKILEEFRGQGMIDKNKLIDILLKISNLSINEKKISEIDFNPVISNEKASYVVDARVITYE